MNLKQKNLEQYHLNRFKETYTCFPNGEIQHSEKPDFLINTLKGKFGIELTEIYNTDLNNITSPQAQENLRRMVLDEAKKNFERFNHSSYFVSVRFSLKEILKYKDIQTLGIKLADYVNQIEIKPGEYSTFTRNLSNRDEFPKEFHRISIYHEKKSNSSTWVFNDSGWVPEIPSSIIKDIIKKKESKINFSKNTIKEIWLLVIAHDAKISASIDLSQECKTETYSTKFDKVFLFWSSSQRYFEFNLQKP